MRRAAAAVLLSACVETIPPPPVPEQIVPTPNVVLGAPAPGEGDVLIDTVGGPADVLDESGFGSAAMSRTICTTPCEVHLSQGLHDLSFVDQVTHEPRGYGRITVGAQRSAYRYALGKQDISYLGLTAAVTLTITGVSLAIPGALGGGSGLLIGGAALTALGVAGYYLLRPRVQQGVGVQWTPSAADSRAPGAQLR